MMNFQFASPLTLLLLVTLPLIWWAVQRGNRGLKPAAVRFSSVAAARADYRSWRIRARSLLPILRLLAAGAIILGLARPQLVQAREVIRGEGVDIALALDISGSMASLDFQPRNRLEAAKEVINEFIGTRVYDQIGLVVFAGNAFNQSPPTVDHNVLRRMLDQAQLATDLGIEDGTALGMGLANAAAMLKDSDAESRVVILLTDGVNNAGQIDPLTAADAAEKLGIKVYTIGMGRSGEVPVPMIDAFGRERVVMQPSTLDEATLQAIAEATGGRYYRAEDSQGLRQIYAEINELETSQIEIETYSSYQELLGWALIPGLLLLLSETLLRQTLLRTIP
jgi:Ca-activated chloride channel family protein